MGSSEGGCLTLQSYHLPQARKPERGSGVCKFAVRNTMAHLDSEAKEECLRKDLKFYFMNPCEKYRARHQIPWKLGLQILKIVMVTTQLVCFGLSNQLVVAFKEENTLAFKHVFLKGYPGIDEDDYSCSVYTEKDTYESIFFAINQYQHLMDITLGILGYGENEDNRIGLKVCKQYYKKETVFPSETLNTDSNIEIVQKNTQYVLVFDSFVIVICLASLILCTRSIVLALRLRKRFLNFFLEKYKRQVCNFDQWKFINGWYVLVIISDLMTIIGSILKTEIKAKNLTDYDLCSILLGTSTLFVWVGVIRYLGYFQAYNVLILTMQASLPKVLRFCACAGMIYLGYTFCGWIVLGPYHDKFEDLNIVAECLFSLINGDDMFATFAQIQQKSILMWLFSRLYLYSFITLFIYMILSLFIALITDSYDTIKKYQQSGFPETDLQEFLKECSSKEKYQK
ncbi:mucolipin-2 isoform X3 [Manis pentadactyla]|uniref:mucolipin-2 isoform X3 n=1 Tax=Manis pentadactyla TaxID=143292 RepID=UPI00255C46BB|nr:mucolipin-2 isoform X3 [Manis pentadactyla]